MKTSGCRDVTLKINQSRWKWHHNTFTTSLHLVPFWHLCFVFVSCVHRRVVEDSGVGSAGVCWWVWGVRYILGTAAIWLVLSMADMVCLVCRNCEVHELSLYGMLGFMYYSFKLCCKLILLLNTCMADMNCYLCGSLWSEQCWVLCWFSKNRLSACREFSGVDSWTRCRDGVKCCNFFYCF